MQVTLREREHECQEFYSHPATNLQPPYPGNLYEEMDELIACTFYDIIPAFFPDAKFRGHDFFDIPSLKITIGPDARYHDLRNSEHGDFPVLVARERSITPIQARVAILLYLSEQGFKTADELLYHLEKITYDRECSQQENLPVAPGVRRWEDDDGFRFLKVLCPFCSIAEHPVYHIHGDYPFTLRVSHCTRLPEDDFEVGGSYLLGDVPCKQ